MKRLLFLLVLFTLSTCTPDFSTPRYTKSATFRSARHIRRISVRKLGTYRNPLVHKEAKRKMLGTRTINLDKW